MNGQKHIQTLWPILHKVLAMVHKEEREVEDPNAGLPEGGDEDREEFF